MFNQSSSLLCHPQYLICSFFSIQFISQVIKIIIQSGRYCCIYYMMIFLLIHAYPITNKQVSCFSHENKLSRRMCAEKQHSLRVSARFLYLTEKRRVINPLNGCRYQHELNWWDAHHFDGESQVEINGGRLPDSEEM